MTPTEPPRATEKALEDAAARLGERLVARGALDPVDLERALAQQAESGGRIGDVLIDLAVVPPRVVISTLAEQLGVAAADLRNDLPDPTAVALLSEDDARALHAIPLRRDEDGVVIAVAAPQDAEIAARVRTAVGEPVRLMLASSAEIDRAINNSYRALDGVARLVETFKVTGAPRQDALATDSVAADNAPVVQLVNLLVTQALRDRASDLHIEPHAEDVRIRCRVDGALHDAITVPASMGPAIVSRLKILAGMNIVERRRPQDGQIAMDIDGRSIDIRVSTAPTISGEKAVLRLLERRRSLLRLDALGMPAQTHDVYSRLVRSPFGMVICAGPTGCGKTTTLYATLAEIEDSERNVTTLEDPVEYVFPSINQIQVNEQAGITFADGLRSILRQDPDMILVGEIRDVETARLAVQSALTGHLVMTSIHATDSASALQRFVDMGIERFLVASSVTGVVSQRLLRRICDHCREDYTPTPEELAIFDAMGRRRALRFERGAGCNFCARTGYQERIGVYELLKISDRIRQLVLDGAVHGELRAAAVAEGMRTLADEAMRLVDEGVTTTAEVLRHIYAE